MATTYTFRFTDGSKNSFQLAPFTSNGPTDPGSATPNPPAVAANTVLRLYGQGMPDYGEGIEQNLIYMLENFANSTPPAISIEGQNWFNNLTKELFLYDGTLWDAVILASGVSSMTADLNMGAGSPTTNKIINLADPTNPQDAITLSYADANYFNVSGDTITGDLVVTGDIIAGGDVLISTGSPINPNAAINKDFADNTYLALSGGTLTGFVILPLGSSPNPLSAISEQYADSRYLNLTGGTLTGVLELANDPVNLLDAATKQYVDSTSGSGGLTNISFAPAPSGSPPVIVSANADTMIFSRAGSSDIQVVGLDYTGKIKPAIEISLTPPGGDVTATDVQSGFIQLDTNKLSIFGGNMVGVLDMTFNNIDNLPTPTTPNHAANKDYVDSALSPAIFNDIFNTDGINDLYSSPSHFAGDNKLQIYVNGQKKYANTYGYTEFTYASTVVFVDENTITNIDPTVTDYNFNIQIDGAVGSPVYNIALPTSGSPPTTTSVDTHGGLINTINGQLALLGISPQPTMNILSFLNAERINSRTQGSTSDIVISDSLTGTYLFDISPVIPIITVTTASGSPVVSTFEIASDQTATFVAGKDFTVINTATDFAGQPNFDGIYTVASSTFSASPGTTTIVLTTPLNLIGNVTANGDIYLTHIAGLVSVSDKAGIAYDYSETDSAGVDAIKGIQTTKIKFTTVPPASEQVEMILFG